MRKALAYGPTTAFAVGLIAALSFGPAAAKPVLFWPGAEGTNDLGMMPMTLSVDEFDSLGADDGFILEECVYECGPEDYPTEPDEPKDDPPGPTSVSSVQTAIITKALENSVGDCSVYLTNEQVDCFRQQMNRLIQSMPADGDYAEMRQAIAEAASELNTIVRETADPAATPVRRTVETPRGKRTSALPVQPIAADKVAEANERAAAVFEKLETRLLRSASGAPSKRVHYELAAQAVNSAKVLLRST